MADKKYEITLDDFGKNGDLINGYGYEVYLLDGVGKSIKRFPHRVFIYGFDGYVLIGQRQKKTDNPVFPIGVRNKEGLSSAEEVAYNFAKTKLVEKLRIDILGVNESDIRFIDNTKIGKSLANKLF